MLCVDFRLGGVHIGGGWADRKKFLSNSKDLKVMQAKH